MEETGGAFDEFLGDDVASSQGLAPPSVKERRASVCQIGNTRARSVLDHSQTSNASDRCRVVG